MHKGFSLDPRAPCWVSPRDWFCLWWWVELGSPSKVNRDVKNSSMRHWLGWPPCRSCEQWAHAHHWPFPPSSSTRVVMCQCPCPQAGEISSHRHQRGMVLQKNMTSFLCYTVGLCLSVYSVFVSTPFLLGLSQSSEEREALGQKKIGIWMICDTCANGLFRLLYSERALWPSDGLAHHYYSCRQTKIDLNSRRVHSLDLSC